jgi:histidyl-tRNA synthetase
MEEMESEQKKNSGTQVLVTLFNSDMLEGTLKIVQMLREASIKTDLFFEADKLKKQLAYAANKGIPYVAIYGPDEARNGNIVLRDMRAGKQDTVDQDELIEKIKDGLKSPREYEYIEL